MATLPADMDQYLADRERIARLVSGMGRGTQATISYRLEVSPTIISRVLSGAEINAVVLGRIDDYLNSQPAAVSAAVTA